MWLYELDHTAVSAPAAARPKPMTRLRSGSALSDHDEMLKGDVSTSCFVGPVHRDDDGRRPSNEMNLVAGAGRLVRPR